MVEECPPLQIIHWLKDVQSSPLLLCTTRCELDGWRLTASRSVSLSQEPLLGWRVIGHEWRLHVSWRDDNTGEVVSLSQSSYVSVGCLKVQVVLGPWTLLTASTVSFHDIFLLINIVGKVGKWLCDEYWPCYEESILQRLC